MSGREDMGRRLYEACLSGSVLALDLLIEEDQFILDRAGSLTGFFNETPLHLVALRGHLDFTKAILTRKPTLASELDSLRRSPLHLASTEGHIKVVEELLRVNPEVCIARDQDGRIPLHLAAMKGRVEIIWKLLEAKPNSIHEKLSRGEIVLHLCVKYNRLEALKTLVQYVHSNGMESLLNSRNDDGNTILHLAAALKQMDTIEYLLGITSVKNHASVKNQNGSTALDVVEHCPDRDLKTMEIRELLLQAGVRTSLRGGLDPNPESPPVNSPRPQRCGKPGAILKGCIRSFWKYIKVDRDWLQQVRGHLITAATLTATMAYQSILSPPGGLRTESPSPSPSPSILSPPGGLLTESDDKAGQAILDSKDGITNYGFNFKAYLILNSIILVASLSTIMLTMTGLPIGNKLVTWLLIFTVYVTITCMAKAYWIALALVSPQAWDSFLGSPDVFHILLFGWLCLFAFVVVLHLCRFLVWLTKKLVKLVVKLVKACHRCCGPRPYTRNNNTTEVNPAGRP